jgi:hypothetical protein
MVAHKKWDERIDTLLFEDLNARGKKSLVQACKSLKKRDTDFASFTIGAMRSRYDKLRRERALKSKPKLEKEEAERPMEEPMGRGIERSKKLDDESRPLIKAMLLLDKARDNSEAWKRIFPKVLAAAEAVCEDVDAGRAIIDWYIGDIAELEKRIDLMSKELAEITGDAAVSTECAEDFRKVLMVAISTIRKMKPAYLEQQKEEADKFETQWGDIDNALKSEKLVDRELKRKD